MRVLWITAITILIDQIAKVLVVRNMFPRDSNPLLGDWLKFTYLENPGMAFGIEFGPPAMISIFSIIATFLIIVYLVKVRSGYYPYRASLGLVLGGALGNIIDRVFYGALYYDAPLFQGHVVDFIHVDVWTGFLPAWIPFMGGERLSLFPIWNVADMAIVIGVVGILVFQKKFHEMLIAQNNASIDQNLSESGVALEAPLEATLEGGVVESRARMLDTHHSANQTPESDQTENLNE